MAAKYDANSISILEGLEAVRKRPGMYIGSVGTKGLNHLIYEIADNAVDEHLAGYCSEITVTLNNDGTATIIDNGRGIPIGIHPKAGIPAVEVVFTVLHAGGKFGDGGYGGKTSHKKKCNYGICRQLKFPARCICQRYSCDHRKGNLCR